MKPFERLHFDARALIRDHPPQWRSERKRLVFETACASGCPFEGELVYAVWGEAEPPMALTARSNFAVRVGVFEYAAPAASTTEWHVNFADPNLFVAYGSALLAQDELQVAEHPILGSVYEALAARGKPPRTVDAHHRPTPVTITGVQRRCAIDTRPNVAAGRPSGLYGNGFDHAPTGQIRAATTSLSPPTTSNILAMAAPWGGYGEYAKEEITYVLNAAFTGFLAARQESERLAPAGSRTVIHTGFWGCGAFGGNRTLMTMLQALAGDLADVEIVFWAFDQQGVELFQSAHAHYGRLRDTASSVTDIRDHLLRQKFQWGVSDGN